MRWIETSEEAKTILEWIEHVWIGKPSTLEIKSGMTWNQPHKDMCDDKVFVTDEVYNEVLEWLKRSHVITHSVNENRIVVKLNCQIK